jgi:RNA polymerase sigma-70 factor (ECF subfamily)
MADELSKIENELLVIDAQDGNTAAMEALVARWQKRLWLYAYRTTSNADAAWEITQDTWMAIIKGLHRLNDPAGFITWAYRIVTNKSCDWIKRKVKKQQSIEELKMRIENEANWRDHDNKNDINSILKKLPFGSSTVLSLYYLEGFSISEVADILNIPKGTVKSRLFKARNEFKEIWQKYL